MYQIDVSTASSTQPASSTLGGVGYFTDGNPATATPATIVPAEFLNSIMLELMNVVTGAGLTLSKSTFNQLYTAIESIAESAVTSSMGAAILGTNGYAVIPVIVAGVKKNVMLQWGTGVSPNSGTTVSNQSIVFPLTFPAACAIAVAMSTGSANSTAGGKPSAGTTAFTQSGFTAVFDTLNFTNFNQTMPFVWFAIGY